MNKDGQMFLELLLVGVGICVLFIFVVVINMAFKNVNTSVQQSTAFNTEGKAIMNDLSAGYSSTWDNVILFFFGGMWVFFLVSTYYLDSHPIFFIIMFIGMVVSLAMLMYLSNIFHPIVNGEAQLAASAAQFPGTSWLVDHLLEAGVLIFFTCMITLYAKPRSGGTSL